MPSVKWQVDKKGLPDTVKIPRFHGVLSWKNFDNLLSDAQRKRNDVRGYQQSQKVYVDGFYITKYPISNGVFGSFIERASLMPELFAWAFDFEHYLTRKKIFENSPNSPVTGVKWEEALIFCLLHGGRLPSDLEYQVSAKYAIKQAKDANVLSSYLLNGCFDRSLDESLFPVGPNSMFSGPGMHTITPSMGTTAFRPDDFEYIVKIPTSSGLIHPGLLASGEVFRGLRNRDVRFGSGRANIGFRLVLDRERGAGK